jgi:hypothetical protein
VPPPLLVPLPPPVGPLPPLPVPPPVGPFPPLWPGAGPPVEGVPPVDGLPPRPGAPAAADFASLSASRRLPLTGAVSVRSALVVAGGQRQRRSGADPCITVTGRHSSRWPGGGAGNKVVC